MSRRFVVSKITSFAHMYMEVFDVSKILLKCLQMSMWLLFQHSCLFAPKIIRLLLFALCDMSRKYVKLTPLETCQKIMTDLCYMHYTETHAHIHRIQMRVCGSSRLMLLRSFFVLDCDFLILFQK